MIKGFRHKGLQGFFENGDAVLVDHQDYHRKEFDMSLMFSPPHPGETLKEDVLPALGLNVTDAAAQLGVTRPALSRVLNGRAAISPEMALRIEGWLGVENGGRADAWIAQQAAYDLWKARKAGAPKVTRATPPDAAAA